MKNRESAQIFLTVAVWGSDFLSLFLEYVLPSYLTEGGIPELPRRGYRSIFWLYTKAESLAAIEAHGSYQSLASLIETKLIAIDSITDVSAHQTVYETMNACHQDFIEKARQAHAAMIFYSPDAFWSDNSLRYTLDQVEKGKRAILLAGMRANKEGVLTELMSAPVQSGKTGFSSRALVDLLLRHPHRITESLTWDTAAMDIGWASHLYWRVAGSGYLARCFHLHTFFVHPRIDASPEVAHDFDWLEKIGLSANEIAIVQNSDDMFALELSPAARSVNGRLGERSWGALADWVCRYAASDHRHYVLHAISLRASGGHYWSWIYARLTSAFIVRSVLVLAWFQNRFKLELQPNGSWQSARVPQRQFRTVWSCLLATIPGRHSS